MKILNFGSLNIDKVYTVDDFVKPGETISSTNMQIFAGGKGLNQSIAAANAGSNIYHAGMIGKEGIFLREILESNNVDTSYLKVVDEETGHAIIQVNNEGQNCILLFSGANHKIDKVYVDSVLDKFESGDIIILQNEISCLKYIIDKAFEKGMKIALNPSPINENLSDLDLDKVEWLILNEIEGIVISGEESANDIVANLLKRFSRLKIVLTLGEKGSIYREGDICLEQEVYKTNVVDTTAAGDTFTGYFISCINKGRSVKEALETASMAASISVSRKGAANSIPYENEVLEKLNREK